MFINKLKWIRVSLMVMIIVSMLSFNPLSKPQDAVAQSDPRIGMVCTTGTASTPTFSLTAQPGNIQLTDGNTMYMWSYSISGQPFQYPGPVLCVNQGDTVTIILNNNLNSASSIVFPGQENVLANGASSQPVFDGNSVVTSMAPTASANGGSMTYSFVAANPGTFIYESGTDQETQVRMGLYGVIVVRPTMGSNFAYNRADSQFTPNEEFLVLLSEIDPYQHQAVENGQPFDINNYHARYWLINGRGFPDSIADNFASWLPSQPYGALSRIYPHDPVNHPYGALAHYINVGTEEYPHHPHANNGVVIGRDGHPLQGPNGEDTSFEKYALNIGPGQTWDVIFKWEDAEHYDKVNNPVTVTIPEMANLTIGMFYSGSPYLGVKEQLPPGVSTLNQCGEYYIISHNHALFQLDAWGATMSSQITYLRVDPPLPNNCP